MSWNSWSDHCCLCNSELYFWSWRVFSKNSYRLGIVTVCPIMLFPLMYCLIYYFLLVFLFMEDITFSAVTTYWFPAYFLSVRCSQEALEVVSSIFVNTGWYGFHYSWKISFSLGDGLLCCGVCYAVVVAIIFSYDS